jgi:sterol desaturase/sphingolipid hydroxylase (fatty acid hydroxylase superfamily)
LNVLTDLRVHWAEDLIATAITFPALFVLDLRPFSVMALGFVAMWHTRLIHANIRTGFGPLGHVLVSPQFHRIHHSIEARHQDRNFGVILTLWDRVFGTMWRRYDEYPATGVEAVDFRPPQSFSPAAWCRHILGQFLYPFRQLGRGGRPAPVPSTGTGQDQPRWRPP